MAFDEDGHARKLRIARWLKPYGISPVTVPSAPVFQWKDGKFTADFSDFDRDVEFLFNECDVNKLFVPKCFELGGWSKPIRPFLSVPFGIDGYDRVFSIAYREMAEHLRQKGWIDRFIYFIADEPHESATDTISGIAHVARMARRIAPEIPIYCSTWYWMPELEDALSMWGLGSVGRVVTGEQLAKINAAGVKWMFTVDGQINIDTPMNGYERILGWLSYKYGAAGYEFWGADWYTFDPWEFGFHRTVEIQMDAKHHSRARFPNGDGYVIYPGRSAGEEPLPSLRLLAARAGIGDYALFQALKQTAKPGDADAAKALKAVCDTVKLPHPMRQSSVFLPDPERMERCRENAGCTLDKLLRQRDLSQP